MPGPEDVTYIEHDFARVTDPNMANPEVLAYCKLYCDCCQSAKQTETATVVLRLAEFAALLRTRPIEQVRASAILGSGEAWLDLAIR